MYGIIIIIILIGTFITCKYNKGSWSLTSLLLIAYGIYTVISYKNIIDVRIKIILGISTILALIYSILVMARKIRSKRNWSKIIWRRIYKCVYAYQSILAIGMAILICSLGIPALLGNSLIITTTKPVETNDLQNYTINNHIDTVLLLQEHFWQELTVEEKLDVLQIVANIEARYLGLPTKLNVSVNNLEESVLGLYADNTYTIHFDLSHVEHSPASDVLNTCCHEAYHSYQYRLVDVYNSTEDNLKGLRLYKEASRYVNEFNNYVSGNTDFYSYYSQQCEEDAREYAEDAVNDYYSRIDEYLK